MGRQPVPAAADADEAVINSALASGVVRVTVEVPTGNVIKDDFAAMEAGKPRRAVIRTDRATMAKIEKPVRAAKPAKEKAMKGKSVKKTSLKNAPGSGNNRPATRKIGAGKRGK